MRVLCRPRLAVASYPRSPEEELGRSLAVLDRDHRLLESLDHRNHFDNRWQDSTRQDPCLRYHQRELAEVRVAARPAFVS